MDAPVLFVLRRGEGRNHRDGMPVDQTGLTIYFGAGNAGPGRPRHVRGPRVQNRPGKSRPTVAIPMDNPYCSCEPTRVRTQIVDFLYEASDGRDRGMVMANGAEPKRRRAGGLDGFASSASLWFLQTVQRSREAETMALPATKVMSCR